MFRTLYFLSQHLRMAAFAGLVLVASGTVYAQFPGNFQPAAEAVGATSSYLSSTAGLNARMGAELQPLAGKAIPEEAPFTRPAPKVYPPNQFQRFVQESTGTLLPLYGYSLFNGDAFQADAGTPAPQTYLLGPGDEIRIQVWGSVDFSTSVTVDRNGQISLPKVGAVTVVGVAYQDLQGFLQSHFSKTFTNFSLSAALGRLRGIQVYVVGQAARPGTYHLSSLSTLVTALFASGGPSPNGSFRNIELQRGGKTVSTLDLYQFIAKGNKSADVALLSGDVIVIKPAGARIAVSGAFDHAAIYELPPLGGSVGDVLGLTGGLPVLTKTRKAQLERVQQSTAQSRTVQEIDLASLGLAVPLQDGDVLTLLDISPEFSNAVTLQGVVAEPLRYRWSPGMTILDLIPNRDALISPDYYKRKNLLGQEGNAASKTAGTTVEKRIRSLADQINWDYAVIERLDRDQLRTQLIPFNLAKAVIQRDPAHNLPLRSGDIVTVLSHNDLRLPQDRQVRLVRVEGEVAAPGIYQAEPGETLPQLLKRVGGLTPQAYLFGAELNRESVKGRQQENLDTIVRKLEAQSQSQSTLQIANLSGEQLAQAQALQVQQQQQVKSQIQTLKALKSNGRVTLEVDPHLQSIAALPPLPLEDGDRILIPSTPSFVSAVGAVNNTNAFVYRPGKTTGEVLRSAGLTEDAEVSEAFVLRADGTAISRRDMGGLFGLVSSFESLPLMPGDTVVVPNKIDRESRYTSITRVVKDWTQILANFGLGVAAINSLSN